MCVWCSSVSESANATMYVDVYVPVSTWVSIGVYVCQGACFCLCQMCIFVFIHNCKRLWLVHCSNIVLLISLLLKRGREVTHPPTHTVATTHQNHCSGSVLPCRDLEFVVSTHCFDDTHRLYVRCRWGGVRVACTLG